MSRFTSYLSTTTLYHVALTMDPADLDITTNQLASLTTNDPPAPTPKPPLFSDSRFPNPGAALESAGFGRPDTLRELGPTSSTAGSSSSQASSRNKVPKRIRLAQEDSPVFLTNWPSAADEVAYVVDQADNNGATATSEKVRCRRVGRVNPR